MRCGMTLFIQGFEDWDRYHAVEAGRDAPPLDPEVDRRRFSEEIETALLAEELGFDSLWTVEHHVSPYTMITNPVQLLTYFAGATSRIDVGTMVVVLPWHHPLRVAEDIGMLQYALRGRTPFIGFGRGAARREFRQMGFDMNESKGRFRESVEIVKRALTEERFSYHGEFYSFEDVTLRPRPLDPEALLDSFHFSWGSPTSAPVGAELGLKPLIIPQRPWPEYHADLESFSDARAKAGLEPVRPRIHMCVYVGETEQGGADRQPHGAERDQTRLDALGRESPGPDRADPDADSEHRVGDAGHGVVAVQDLLGVGENVLAEQARQGPEHRLPGDDQLQVAVALDRLPGTAQRRRQNGAHGVARVPRMHAMRVGHECKFHGQ